jgi:ribosome maturation factor RimP
LSWLSAVERTVTGLGYELVDTERASHGLLRVYIDRVQGDPTGAFVTVEDCERVTRQLQHVLEVEHLAYARLEVSSPGLDRPLKRSSDYRRFAGEQVDVTLKLPFNGRRKYRGELALIDAEGPDAAGDGDRFRLIFEDGRNGEQALDFAIHEVREARLVPVLDFKGRRFAPAPAANEPGNEPAQEATTSAMDGDPQQ